MSNDFNSEDSYNPYSNSGLVSHEEDPLASIVRTHKLFLLGYASGVLDEIPEGATDSPPKNRCTAMWTTAQLIRLQSELIKVSLVIDSFAESIHQSQEKSLEKIFNELQEEENRQPLGYFRMSTNPSESEEFYDEQMTPEREQTPAQQEERRKESRRRHTSDRVKSLGRTEQATESQQEKMTKQDLIWDNTDLFMKPITSINKFSSVLAPSKKIEYPPTILTDPFGPHYSISLLQDPDLFLDDPNKSQLIMPPPPSLDARPKGVFAQMHTRMMATILDITPQEHSEYNRHKNVEAYDLKRGQELIDKLINYQNKNDSAQLKLSEKAAPLPTGLGVAHYGMLGFDERLKLELQSLSIIGNDLPMGFSDCPVSKCIEYQVLRQDELVANTNKIKERMMALLQSRREAFDEEIAYKRDWDAALQRFLDNQAQKQQLQPQQSKKKKKLTE
ncbi:hypothetical protein TRFO_39530 [Tritrichomonas foetus]|uniref:Uncharacterized protein n=1 Tax=Tritrichomonas foetus TaxID=1144522 RepID=A0A1J4J7Q8_9EUKA|nr:hypothetical protein TRFO_39530 [Tritrichomonas foetus]|eukprot:OHS94263.1 hypothetical protein TRFO_39530 [Tritrichomonas foetus]